MRVVEEPTQFIGATHNIDRANAAVGDVERVGSGPANGWRMSRPGAPLTVTR